MKFLIQNNGIGIEERIIMELIENAPFSEYEMCNLDDIRDMKEKTKDYIPIGTIDFVTRFLNVHYGIRQEHPIEIPKYLRIYEFLKRNYKIMTWDGLPEMGNGRVFLKDVSVLKHFGMEVDTDFHNVKDWSETNTLGMPLLYTDSLYQVSEVLDVKSEYRVYVLQGKIRCITHYAGNPLMLPDTKLIQKAAMLIDFHEKFLKSYTMDVMVGGFGTAIIEIHNFTSVGLYSTIWDNSLLYGYADGLEYLIKDNRCLEAWE